MSIEFVYFDLGNVLVSFDAGIACRNLAAISDVPADRIRQRLHESGIHDLYEKGQIGDEEYAERTREALDVSAAKLSTETFLTAISDMFTPIESMAEIVNDVRRRIGRVGLLSNTCRAHWEWIRQQPWRVSQLEFDVTILSYEVGSMKPEPAIYAVAEKASDVGAESLLFVDDRDENVLAAQSRGWNAEICFGGDEAERVLKRWIEI